MKLDDLELDLNTSHELIEVLRFYGDPTTYWAVALVSDNPSGDIMSDFSKTDLGHKPGRKAREILLKLNDLAKEIPMTRIDGDAMEVKTASEIEEQVNILRTQVDNLAEWISKLEKRIDPVLVPDYDTEKTQVEENCNTALGGDIREIRLSIEGLRRHVQRLSDRVEL